MVKVEKQAQGNTPRIFVAPNGARRGKSDHPALPVTISEIVQTARTCFGAGATGIHAHVRDKNALHVLDRGLYRELLDELGRVVPQMAVQISTGAVERYRPAEQRELVLTLRPKMLSIALREMFAEDDLQEVSRFYYELREQGIEVQHIVYSPAEFSKLAKLMMVGTLPGRDKSVLFVLGEGAQNQQSDLGMFGAYLDVLNGLRLAESWRFMACAFGIEETACLVACARSGGDCRVGFENNLLNVDGSTAGDNAQRVAALVVALKSAGITPARTIPH